MKFLINLNNLQGIRNLEELELDRNKSRRFHPFENAFHGKYYV